MSIQPEDLLARARELEPWMVERRRDFHRHPELGFQEVRTAGIVAQELNALGLEVRTGMARTGVVGLLEGDRPGPTVLLRFDMDALPIQEENATDYVSTQPSVMHACGHDGHTTIGLTVARLLAPLRRDMTGTLKFVFQPAEEGAGGGELMVKEGVLENPAPDYSLALHLWNNLPSGLIGVSDGPTMAADSDFSILVEGKGGHAALPHQCHDPIVAAAHVVAALQTLVAREVSPIDTGVLSVTKFHAGTANNIIPDRAELAGTIRTFTPEVRDLLSRRLQETARGGAEALGCTAQVEVVDRTPPVINDPAVAGVVREVAAQLFGAQNVRPELTMGSEDMAFMMQTVPGCYFFVGTARPDRGPVYAHHSPRFDIDEAQLAPAAALMASAAARYVLAGSR
jgi:amidohydrolase